MSTHQREGASPLDQLAASPHNERLVQQTHPTDWINPEPAEVYNLVVIGAGAGGLVSTSAVSQLGGRVALIEAHLMGGDCLVYGCVPSKALLHAAHTLHTVRHRTAECGIALGADPTLDFHAMMERMRALRADISPVDSAWRFKDLGADVFFGRARFTSPSTVEVNGQTLTFHTAIIATGGTPHIPDIPGLADAPYHTNETIFTLDALPERLAVLGGGAVGCELAQAFARFGSDVTLIDRNPRLLKIEDEDVSTLIHDTLTREGVTALLSHDTTQVTQRPDGALALTLRSGDTTREVVVDALLVASGRRPNVRDLGLEAAGVAYTERDGVQTDAHLRTTNKRVFAVGDATLRHKLTHMAGASAGLVVRNAFFMGRQKIDDLVVPWCTYTDPEVAHVGMTTAEIHDQKIPHDTFEKHLSDVDRAILTGDTEGFVRIHTRAGTDTILGATIVGRNAGDLISQLTFAMTNGLGLSAFSSTIYPYPTTAEAIKSAAGQYMAGKLTPRVKGAMDRWFSWRR